MGATESRSVILPSEQAIAEGGGFNVRVGRHCVIFQCRRPCARLVPVLKRAAWASYGEIGHEATEYEPWRGRDQRGAVQSATQTNRRRIPCWGQERQQDLFYAIGPIGQSDGLPGGTSGQSLIHDGTTWVPSNNLTIDEGSYTPTEMANMMTNKLNEAVTTYLKTDHTNSFTPANASKLRIVSPATNPRPFGPGINSILTLPPLPTVR